MTAHPQIAVNLECRLIAIMLGRLRMSVADCLHEYKTLGGEIFGKPRFFTELKFILISRAKYDSKVLERVFQGVAERHREVSDHNYDYALFPSERGLCGT